MATEHQGTTTTAGAPRPTRPLAATSLESGRGGGGSTTTTTFLRKAQNSCSQILYWNNAAPTSTQLIGFLTLLVSGTVLLFFTGVTITLAILTLVFFAPLVVISSPVWIPVGALLFVLVSGFLMACGCFVAFVAGLSWMYSYFRGMHPPGSDRVEYARNRIVDTAAHVKDCAREYSSGYMQDKTNKDVAPGA
ncbi:unnamed protein product [Linum tenue]|uniref:Oleosin n=1 Tax=Linum tenue TaxID=586396 RepID=A0AAV0MWT6_9ROSI|nr:unnamed protein product [Linum tenue]